MERQKFTKIMDLSERMYLRRGGKERQTCEISVIDRLMKSVGKRKRKKKLHLFIRSQSDQHDLAICRVH